MLMDHKFHDAGSEGFCEAPQQLLPVAEPLILLGRFRMLTVHVQATTLTHGLNKSKPDNYILRQKMNTSDVGLYFNRLSSLTLVVCVPYWKLKHTMLSPT